MGSMETLRLSTKGQIVVPKEIRERHRWEAGTELVIEDRGDLLVLRTAKPFPPTRLEDGLGCTGYRGPAKSPDEMDATVDDALPREWAPGGS
jgi:AbrB family looped-hinge helix DNA binding protein